MPTTSWTMSATALHWQNIPGILAHPLFIASRPCEMVEDARARIIDVIFTAVYQINQAA